jgi:hypothetical protein
LILLDAAQMTEPTDREAIEAKWQANELDLY